MWTHVCIVLHGHSLECAPQIELKKLTTMFGNRNCGTNITAHARKKDTSVLFEIHLIPFI